MVITTCFITERASISQLVYTSHQSLDQGIVQNFILCMVVRRDLLFYRRDRFDDVVISEVERGLVIQLV